MKHTKGPWNRNHIWTSDREIKVVFEHISDSVSDSEYIELQANANLLAVAPEMFEFLIEVDQCNVLTDSFKRDLKKLIFKAQGNK